MESISLCEPDIVWSAPKIFTAVADAVEWVTQAKEVNFVIHFLNGFY